MRADIDAPVEPIDPHEDVRRVARARRYQQRSALTMLATLAHPLLAIAGGLVLGAWHARAPLAGAVGMMLAWLGARGVLLTAGTVAALFEAPSLARRLFGRAGDAAREPAPFRRTAAAVLTVHAMAFAVLAAFAGIAAGLIGPGGVHAVDVAVFALLGLALGLGTAWTEPG